VHYLIIDGSYGEGGGQIVRTAVCLSVITGKPIQLINIRAKRNNPGLRHQHLSAVKAIADLFHAKVENLKVGADWIRFVPLNYSTPSSSSDHFDASFLYNDNNSSNCNSSSSSFLNKNSSSSDNFDYSMNKIDIGTAGSIANVLLTIIPAISLSRINHDIQIIGGTDVRYSPTIDYVRYIVREIYASIGINFSIDVLRRGYYPKGGGIVNAQIKAINIPSWQFPTLFQLSDEADNLNSIITNYNRHNLSRTQDSTKNGSVVAPASTSIIKGPPPESMKIKIASVCSQLPKHVAERQLSAASSNLTKNGVETINDSLFTTTCEGSLSPGSSVLVFSVSRNDNSSSWYIGGDSIGEKGKRAESVGIEASNRFIENYLKNVPIDYLLADMLVVPLSLMRGKNQFRVAKVTQHLKTNLYVVSRMVEMYKYYIKDACLPTATATTSPNVEENTIGCNEVSGSNGYIVNIESGGQQSK
jgi:RNA 3'-terminal phosphate cyclase (ATP)